MQKSYRRVPQHGYMHQIENIKGSRFWGIVFVVTSKEDVKWCLEDVQQRYPDSSHACYAYRVWDLAQSSDAWEPAGTAWKPIAHILEQSWLNNVLVVVLRQFGGTLLGAGWLVRAYSRCAAALLDHVPYRQEDIWTEISLQFSYDHMGTVISLVEQHGGEIVSQEDGLLARMHIRINRGVYADFREVLKDTTRGEVLC